MENIANQLGVDGDRLQWLLGNTTGGKRRTRELVFVKRNHQDSVALV